MSYTPVSSKTVDIPEPVINWLFNVIQPIYHDPRRTFHDSVAVLSQFKQLRPRTRVFTSASGTSELLLCIYGKLEVGSSLPIQVWLPMSYPIEHPLLFIDLQAAAGSRLCVGRYVAADGAITLPMLDHWHPEVSNLSQMIEELISINFRDSLLVAEPAASQTYTMSPLPELPPKPPAIPPRPHTNASSQQLPPRHAASSELPVMTPAYTGPPSIPERPPTAVSTDLLDTEISANENVRHYDAIEHLRQTLEEIRLSSSLATAKGLETRKAAIRSAIKQFEMTLEYEGTTLQRSFEAIEETKASLNREIDAIQQQTERIEAYESRQGDSPDPNTIIATENNIVGQLYTLVAKDCALSDAVNTLSRLYANEAIKLDALVKKTRGLAREQFLIRLHMHKLITHLQQQP